MTETNNNTRLLEQPSALAGHISGALYHNSRHIPLYSGTGQEPRPSAVLFLLSTDCPGIGPEPCVILNKRSQAMKQPGDLCCPGGSISPLDAWLSRILTIPGFPLNLWPYWPMWRDRRSFRGRRLSLFLAAALREGFEEMRLNPLNVRFLGPLPPEHLRLFRRVIYPLVCEVKGKQKFTPNPEVEKLVYIPLQSLLNPCRYALYRVWFTSEIEKQRGRQSDYFPCFIHEFDGKTELLWGATFRIAAAFLSIVFGFTPPALETLPVISGTLNEAYLTGV